MIVECESCEGTGLCGGDADQGPCLDCDGAGEVDVCDACEGTHVIENGSGSRLPCAECQW